MYRLYIHTTCCILHHILRSDTEERLLFVPLFDTNFYTLYDGEAP